MPIYEFDCKSCQHAFEELVARPSAVDQVVCPQCQSDEVKKKLSLFASKSSKPTSSFPSSQACTTST